MAVSPPGPCLLGQLDLELKSHPETPRVRDGKNPNESPSPVRVMGTGTEPYPQGVEKSPTPPPPVTHRIDGDHMVTLDFHHCPQVRISPLYCEATMSVSLEATWGQTCSLPTPSSQGSLCGGLSRSWTQNPPPRVSVKVRRPGKMEGRAPRLPSIWQPPAGTLPSSAGTVSEEASQDRRSRIQSFIMKVIPKCPGYKRKKRITHHTKN